MTEQTIIPEPFSRCEKCGSEDVNVVWHAKNEYKHQPCGYGNHEQVKKEHLHYGCRRCKCDWTGPLRGAA